MGMEGRNKVGRGGGCGCRRTPNRADQAGGMSGISKRVFSKYILGAPPDISLWATASFPRVVRSPGLREKTNSCYGQR